MRLGFLLKVQQGQSDPVRRYVASLAAEGCGRSSYGSCVM